MVVIRMPMMSIGRDGSRAIGAPRGWYPQGDSNP
jgi:hypothetical protein